MRACNTRTARTCVSEKEPEHRNQPVPRVAAQSIGLCVAPARNTPGQICTRAKARREANQLAARHEYSISLHRNITSADRFAGKGKIETVFLPLRRTAKIGNISPINASLSSGEAAQMHTTISDHNHGLLQHKGAAYPTVSRMRRKRNCVLSTCRRQKNAQRREISTDTIDEHESAVRFT